MSKNIAASVRARLKNHADRTDEPFDLVLTRYGLERILYRLSVSKHAPNFLLKGALLFTLWYDHPHRPTRDADLLGFGPDDTPTAEAVFREVCAIEVDDGVQFDPKSVKGSDIRKGAGYNGVRIDILGKLEKARLDLQIDIGFGDAVTPGPVSVTYPVLLEDQPAAKLQAYPKYTVVAEKFEAICKLGQGNSRMKDYFDLWVLLGEGDLDSGELRRAIEATLERRKTPRPAEMPIGLTDAFTSDPAVQRLWTAFLKKNRLDSLNLAAVVALVRDGIAETGIIGQAGKSKA